MHIAAVEQISQQKIKLKKQFGDEKQVCLSLHLRSSSAPSTSALRLLLAHVARHLLTAYCFSKRSTSAPMFARCAVDTYFSVG